MPVASIFVVYEYELACSDGPNVAEESPFIVQAVYSAELDQIVEITKTHISAICPVVVPETDLHVAVQQMRCSKDLLDRLVCKSPTAEIEIAGISVGCVLDTGAETSLLPSSFYCEHLSTMGIESLGRFVKIVGVNDLEVPVDSYLDVPTKIFGETMMASPGDLLHRPEDIPRVLDWLLVDLGTNELCPQDALPGLVVDIALALVEPLRQSNRSSTTIVFFFFIIVFMSVIQQTSKGRHLAVSLRCFSRCAQAFNAKLAARIQFKTQVYLYTQPINHPRFICSDGCHLTDEGVQKYGGGIRRAVLRHHSGKTCVANLSPHRLAQY